MGIFKMKGQNTGNNYAVGAETKEQAKAAIKALYGETNITDASFLNIDEFISIEEKDYVNSAKYNKIINGQNNVTETTPITSEQFREIADSHSNENVKSDDPQKFSDFLDYDKTMESIKEQDRQEQSEYEKELERSKYSPFIYKGETQQEIIPQKKLWPPPINNNTDTKTEENNTKTEENNTKTEESSNKKSGINYKLDSRFFDPNYTLVLDDKIDDTINNISVKISKFNFIEYQKEINLYKDYIKFWSTNAKKQMSNRIITGKEEDFSPEQWLTRERRIASKNYFLTWLDNFNKELSKKMEELETVKEKIEFGKIELDKAIRKLNSVIVEDKKGNNKTETIKNAIKKQKNKIDNLNEKIDQIIRFYKNLNDKYIAIKK